jgi:hypothetical protein
MIHRLLGRGGVPYPPLIEIVNKTVNDFANPAPINTPCFEKDIP